jgi:uncharacterized OsmC-like protein
MTITEDPTRQNTVADGLRTLLEATAVGLAAHPEAAVIRPAAQSHLVAGTPTQVSVRAGGHDFTIDEPASLGGTDIGANPVEHLLASLGACQVITYQLWAAKLGVSVDTIEVDVTGELDVHGFFGLDPDVRPGFTSIEVSVRLGGPESVERYVELTSIVEEHCPVLDVLVNGVPVTSSFAYNAA